MNGQWKGVEALALAAILAALVPAVSAMTLEECIAAALADSPDAAAALQRTAAAQAAITEAQSAWYPQLGFASAYSVTNNPPQAFFMRLNQRTADMRQDPNQPDPEPVDNWRNSLVARYFLYDPKRSPNVELARLGHGAAAALHAAVRNDLVHQVTRGWYAARQAQAFIAVQEETEASLQESLRVARARFQAGGAVKSDVLNLEVSLAQAGEGLIRARNGFRLAVAALNTAIGRDFVPAKTPLPDDAAAPLPAAPEPVDEARIPVPEARPELRLAQLQARSQAVAVEKARADFLPRVAAFASSDWDSDLNRGTAAENSYMAGLTLEWDLFTGFRREAAVRGAEAQQRAAQADLQKARNTLRLDLIQAELGLQEAWERYQVAARTSGSAEEALRLTRERYEKGAADITELLTAQLGLTATRTREQAAKYDFLIAQSNVARARGELGTAAGRPAR